MKQNLDPVDARTVIAGSADRPNATAPVVVGIDDRPLEGFRQSILFATAEAVRRKTGILLVHGCEPLRTATSLEAGHRSESPESGRPPDGGRRR